MTRRLYRSRKKSIIAGVCGGIAEYFEVDPTIVRLLWVIMAFVHGLGVIAYIVAWIIIPERPEGKYDGEHGEAEHGEKVRPDSRTHGEKVTGRANARFIGLALIMLGAWFLVRNFMPWVEFDRWWPLILVAIGVALLIKGLRS